MIFPKTKDIIVKYQSGGFSSSNKDITYSEKYQIIKNILEDIMLTDFTFLKSF